MSDNCFNIKIEEPIKYNLHIENSVGDSIKNIDIIQSGFYNLEINPCTTFLPSDFETVVDAEIASFVLAGSGINIQQSVSGIIINATPYTSGNFQFLTVSGIAVSLSGHVHAISDINGLQTELDNKQPSGLYASGVHYHNSSDITNFNNSVSGLLPSISGAQYVDISFNNNIYEVNINGLQPSGNYSIVGHNHIINDVSGLQIALDSKQPSGLYASGIHSHIVNDITDFHSGVSGLLPQLSGSQYITTNFNNNIYTIGISGLQPSGNYSLVGHSHIISDVSGLQIALDNKQPSGIYASGIHYHISSDITDFHNAVSGLIPPPSFTSLSGISGISVTNSGTNYFVGLTDPSIQLLDITDLPSGARTFLLSSTSENLSSLVTNETGSGLLVFNNSPSFSGTPTAPTAPSGTNNDQIANTQFVRTEISNLVNSAPATLDTLNELAIALGNDPNFATTIASGLGQKANLSGAIFSGSVTIPSGTGNFDSLTVNNINVSISGHNHTANNITDFNISVSGLLPSVTGTDYVTSSFGNNTYSIGVTGLQPSGNYSIVGHTHTSSNITDFNSGVSGLLPNISGSTYINTNFNNNTYTISAIGLQPSGNYSLVGHSHIISDVSGLQNALDSKQPSGIYASGVHYHLSSDITDFNAGVSGLLPSITGIDYITTSFSGNMYSIGVTGLQPSGNYSVVGHNHSSSDITDFNSSVSGLIPVKNILSGTNIQVSSLSGDFTVSATGLQPSGNYSVIGHTHTASNITDFNTSVSGLLPVKNILSGSNITVNNVSGQFTVGASGLAQAVHQHVYTDITNFASGVESSVSTLLQEGSYVDLDYDNINHTLTINVTGVQPSGNYSIVGHSHTISDITNFASGVSGLLPSINGSGYVISSFNQNAYTISVSGLQPSGNYSVVGHSHISSDITDFNSSVSGLLPVKNITAGTGIFVSSLSGIYTITSTVNEVERAASLVTTVFNTTGSVIPKFSVVYINGGQGDQPTINLAIASGESTSSKTYGITYEAISHMSTGRVVVEGALTGVDTDQFNPTAPVGNVNGTVLYLSPSVSGGVTTTKPSAPNHLVSVGTIVRTHQNAGVVEVRIQNGFELQELHNVAINGVTNGQFLQYNSGSGLWVPSSSGNFISLNVNGTGVSLNGHTHTSSNITDFSTSVSGLLPAISGSTYITSNFDNNIYTISTTGLQPSGNYSVVGHSHSSSDITDFNSSVSGLLPTISNSGDNRVLTSTGSSVGINAENNLTFDGSTLNIDGNLVFDSFTESLINVGNSSSGVILSIGSGTVQACTLTNNCTFTMPTVTAGKSFTLFLNTGSGNYTASFSGVLWNDSSPPTITTSASKVDILSFISDGNYWYGSYSQNYGS